MSIDEKSQVDGYWKEYKKLDEAILKEKLTPLQYKVTQENGTEKPFQNEYYYHKERGIYVDVVSGEPLFSSLDKYESGSGWPSFSKPLVPKLIIQHEDKSHWMQRIEVRSFYGNSHLGHLFDDGPAPTGRRYCINSASLRFVPLENMAEEGYQEFISLFQ